MKKKTGHNHTTGGRVTAESRPWLSLTNGSVNAMVRLCETRSKRYFAEGRIPAWTRNRDLLLQLEIERASRN